MKGTWTMTERRSHWDASLISAVLADLRDVYDSGYGEEQAFRIIAAVEDWVLSAPFFDLYLSRKHAPDRAAIQRVREQLHKPWKYECECCTRIWIALEGDSDE